jgi:hypothetical protein
MAKTDAHAIDGDGNDGDGNVGGLGDDAILRLMRYVGISVFVGFCSHRLVDSFFSSGRRTVSCVETTEGSEMVRNLHIVDTMITKQL